MNNLHPLAQSDFKKSFKNYNTNPTYESYETKPSSREDTNIPKCEKLGLSVEEWTPVFTGYLIEEKLG